MNILMNSIQEKIQPYIQFEVHMILWVLVFIAVVFYNLFLKSISQKRHTNLKRRFILTFLVLIISFLFSSLHLFINDHFEAHTILKSSAFIAFMALLMAAIGVVRIAQIYVYLYLFFMNISQGIPRLIVNLFTVLFSLIVSYFFATEIFSINITAMLTTSAVFSLVLGLALQDTLGNLFSGLALQIGQTFKLGDWVEINMDSKKWIGQIHEITWRATFITSFSDELLMVPNKTMAQSQILLFSNNQKTLRMSQVFRVDYDADIFYVKSIMLEAIKNIDQILKEPAPKVLITETNESWVTLKIFYTLNEFSTRYSTGDHVIQNILNELKNKNIKLASSKIQVLN